MINLKQPTLRTLNLKDTHFRLGFTAPKGRSDEEFSGDIFNKVSQIERLCIQNKVDLITIAGDVFDIKEASRYTIKQLSLLLKILTQLRNSTRLKLLLTIAGNHDLPNSSRAMKSKSVYGFFQKLGLIEDIHHSELTYNLNNKFQVSFYGIDYTNKITQLNKEIKEYHNTIKPKPSHYKTLMIHEHLLRKNDMQKKEAKYLGNKSTYEAMLKKYPNINVFIAGHYHYGYDTYHSGDRVIINNWNLTRLARNYYVLNGSHKPNVVITTYTRKGITTKDIDLEVREYVKVINEEELKEAENINIEIQEFVEKINDSKIAKGVISNIKLNNRQQELLESILEESKTEVQE